jgi:hypothetical protein
MSIREHPIRSPALLLSHAPYRPSASWTFPQRMKYPLENPVTPCPWTCLFRKPGTHPIGRATQDASDPPCVFCFLGHAKHCGDHTPVLIMIHCEVRRWDERDVHCTAVARGGVY